MSCATSTIKYLLFIFNTIWAISGILLVLFGGLGWDAMPTNYAIGTIVFGGVIIFISFFGCVGAVRESSRLLWTYATFLSILAVLTIVFIITDTRDVFKKFALKGVEDLWALEETHPGAMNITQSTYQCCGRYGPDDYVLLKRMPPNSCCVENNCLNPLNIYKEGCLKKVEAAFADEATTTQYYEWGVLAFSLILLVLVCLLAIHYRNRKRRFNY